MKNLLLLSAMAVAGCSSAVATPKVEPAGAESPKSDRFRPGQAGMVSGAAFSEIRAADGREWSTADPEYKAKHSDDGRRQMDVFVAEGDRLVILADDGRDWIRVRMESGSKEGKSYTIRRGHVIATP